MTRIRRVLVANRGEIALRIVRACHEEGLEAIAVYSDVDRLAPYVRAADDAVPLGGAAPSESYLRGDRLIAAAREAACEAVHPGYGFLSERADFARAVEAAGLTFVGPPWQAIAAMGEKTEARRRMRAAGVPVVPGSLHTLATAADAARAAAEVGYPVMFKAAAGGGGRGMRVVNDEGAVEGAFQAAASEARKAFGDGSIYLERYVDRPRHIEVQVLADAAGRVAAVGERECSIQRRHQKLIEEAPSPAVDVPLRARLAEAACAAARAVGYRSAGTIEFLLAPDQSFYFLEMNTRIQVEHPVTEEVYGVDLVREQLRIAAGATLELPAVLEPQGHAIECRITAEDPFAGFVPATGRLAYLRIPGGPGVRWDGGLEAGNDVTRHYDSLVGKLVAWAESRPAAIQRMRRALRELIIVGVPTSQPFHLRVMDEPSFARGDVDITYVDRTGRSVLEAPLDVERLRAAAVAAALLAEEARGQPGAGWSGGDARRHSAWAAAGRRDALRE